MLSSGVVKSATNVNCGTAIGKRRDGGGSVASVLSAGDADPQRPPAMGCYAWRSRRRGLWVSRSAAQTARD